MGCFLECAFFTPPLSARGISGATHWRRLMRAEASRIYQMTTGIKWESTAKKENLVEVRECLSEEAVARKDIPSIHATRPPGCRLSTSGSYRGRKKSARRKRS